MVFLAMISLGNLPQCLATFSTGKSLLLWYSLMPRTLSALGIHSPLSQTPHLLEEAFGGTLVHKSGHQKSDCSGPGSLAIQPMNM